MNCEFIFTGKKKGERFAFKCQRCESEATSPTQDVLPRMNCGKPGVKPANIAATILPPFGVGSALADIFNEIGAKPKVGCKCKARARELDRNGIEWCKSNRETIIGWLKEAYAEL